MQGILRVAVVDCLAQDSLCKELGEDLSKKKHPTYVLKLFDGQAGPKGENFELGDWKGMSTLATRTVRGTVQSIDSMPDYLEKYLGREDDRLRVVLITDRKTTSPIYRALSSKYQDKFLFGEIKTSANSLMAGDLAKLYGLSASEKLFLVTKETFDKSSVIAYKGSGFELEALSKFLLPYTKS